MNARRKQTIAAVFIMVAIALDLVAAWLSSSRVHAQTVGMLYAVALAVLLAGLVFMILNRKRSA
jgi:hypothetical protein